MTEKIRSRQYQILTLLLENKAGLSIDEVVAKLNISRNAVQQHFMALERDGYIQTHVLNKTGGRPVRIFVLTEDGVNRFPKQYAWFSELILADLKNELGSEAFKRYLNKLAHYLSKSLLPQFEGKQLDERVERLLHVMDGLGFNARTITASDSGTHTIEAYNCVYHDLAQKHEEICEFDRVLIASILDKTIDHVECMAKGGTVCRFKILS